MKSPKKDQLHHHRRALLCLPMRSILVDSGALTLPEKIQNGGDWDFNSFVNIERQPMQLTNSKSCEIINLFLSWFQIQTPRLSKRNLLLLIKTCVNIYFHCCIMCRMKIFLFYSFMLIKNDIGKYKSWTWYIG